ncbi:hypothetical protein [Variovorax sp. 38R]|nr:hypothetical protein [Variovorax sp. 38R]
MIFTILTIGISFIAGDSAYSGGVWLLGIVSFSVAMSARAISEV